MGEPVFRDTPALEKDGSPAKIQTSAEDQGLPLSPPECGTCGSRHWEEAPCRRNQEVFGRPREHRTTCQTPDHQARRALGHLEVKAILCQGQCTQVLPVMVGRS